MPIPMIRGHCVTEVQVPAKTVFQHECDRCKRTWFSDAEKKSPRIVVSILLPDSSTLGGELTTLCDSCEKTCLDAVKVIFKPMKKTSPTKSGAKEKATGALPEPKLPTTPVVGRVRTSREEVLQGPSDPSTPR